VCADNGIVVTGYKDQSSGTMVETAPGEAQFSSVVLEPVVTVRAGSNAGLAARLHERAHELCFIARSVNFPVSHRPRIVTEA
jgi:organic hydroperoxide reductase OsmC/OhrA